MPVKTYTAKITGTPDWELTPVNLNIDLSVTNGAIELESVLEADYDEAITRLAGNLQVFEIEDGGIPQQIASVPMEAINKQDIRKRSTSIIVTLRADGPVAAWTTVTDYDVESLLTTTQDRASGRSWTLPYQRVITPGSTVLRGTDRRMTVDRSAINVIGSQAVQVLTEDGTP
jgi:hypothetical protein